MQEDWNSKVGKDACGKWQGICGPFSNDDTSDFWSLPPLTILCWRTLLVITKHLEDGAGTAQMEKRHSQIDSILVRTCFRSGMNIARTRSFPGTDIGCDHDLLMMTFHLWLKRISKPNHTRLKFGLEKLKDPNVLLIFQAMINRRFTSHRHE